MEREIKFSRNAFSMPEGMDFPVLTDLLLLRDEIWKEMLKQSAGRAASPETLLAQLLAASSIHTLLVELETKRATWEDFEKMIYAFITQAIAAACLAVKGGFAGERTLQYIALKEMVETITDASVTTFRLVREDMRDDSLNPNKSREP